MSRVDVESMVVETLRARADRVVKVDGLRAGAITRAGVIRRRRAIGTAGAGLASAAAVAAIAAGGLVLPWSSGGGNAEPGPVAADPPSQAEQIEVTTGPTTLPELTGTPGAAEQPAAVGTHPGTLHFDLDLTELDPAAYDLEVTDWHSGPGYEGVSVSTLPGFAPHGDVYIGSDAEALAAGRPEPGPYLELTGGDIVPLYEEGTAQPTMVDGRPATIQEVVAFDLDEDVDISELEPREAVVESLRRAQDRHGWVLRWQPVDGLHAIAQVEGADRALAYAMAEALRLDRAQRCVVPMLLTAIPDGAEWTECQTALRHRSADGGVTWKQSQITLVASGDDAVAVFAEDVAQSTHPADDPIVPNRTVAGHPAWWSSQSPAGLFVPEIGPAAVFVSGADEDQASWLIEHLRVVGDVDRPGTWPPRAIG